MSHFPSSAAHYLPPVEMEMTERQFLLFRDLIFSKTGISLRDTKGPMLSARLNRRLRAHNLTTFESYYQLLAQHDPTGEENRELINSVTTNKTSFFRESHHFEFLENLCRKSTATAPFSVWSAACSSGEEAYSIAMTIRGVRENATATGRYNILASDIDTQVLQHARSAIYREEALDSVPAQLRNKFFLRGSGSQAGHFRIKPALREQIEFRQLNFVDPSWDINGAFDVIFCRNVLIYFDHPTQNRILRRLIGHLKPRGHLIVGHSEHLHWMTDVLEPVGTTIYRTKLGG